MNQSISSIVGSAANSLQPSSSKPVSGISVTKQFGNMLQDAIQQLENQQHTVDALSEQFNMGQLEDVHKLTIEMQKAQLGMELAVQVRNKAIEAYQEIMRTQI